MGTMEYQIKSIEQLFVAYAFENDRICRKDAESTQHEIVKELYRRLKVSLDMLETANEAEAKKIYQQFIEH